MFAVSPFISSGLICLVDRFGFTKSGCWVRSAGLRLLGWMCWVVVCWTRSVGLGLQVYVYLVGLAFGRTDILSEDLKNKDNSKYLDDLRIEDNPKIK